MIARCTGSAEFCTGAAARRQAPRLVTQMLVPLTKCNHEQSSFCESGPNRWTSMIGGGGYRYACRCSPIHGHESSLRSALRVRFSEARQRLAHYGCEYERRMQRPYSQSDGSMSPGHKLSLHRVLFSAEAFLHFTPLHYYTTTECSDAMAATVHLHWLRMT
jgi:hypothetical protein